MEVSNKSREDFIIELFCRIDAKMLDVRKHNQANLWPSEVVTLASLLAIKGVGKRAFYGWLARDWKTWFPRLPERTRLFGLFKTHRDWAVHLLADPTLFGVIDSYGIEWIHPIREGRSPPQMDRKGLSHHRWMVGGKSCRLVNKFGWVVAWACSTAKVADHTFQPLIQPVEGQIVVFSDGCFHAQRGDASHLKRCPRRQWNDRMVVETVLSMLTLVQHFKKVMHPVWEYFQARLAFTMAAFNVLAQWYGLQADQDGFVSLSIAEFSL